MPGSGQPLAVVANDAADGGPVHAEHDNDGEDDEDDEDDNQ
jgi:hypothetical protein